MKQEEKYRLAIILSYILVIVCSVTLFISIWNHLSLNPGINTGNGMYFLLFGIIILASGLFIIHLMEEHHFQISDEHKPEELPEADNPAEKASIESYISPYDVDIDVIADNIVPRIDPREAIADYAERILGNLTKRFEAVQGVFYLKNPENELYESLCTFAYTSDSGPASFKAGEGITGQVAKNKTPINIRQVPDSYLKVESALGSSSPKSLYIMPLLLNKEVIGIIELALFHEIDREKEWTLKNLAKIIGNAIVTKLKAGDRK